MSLKYEDVKLALEKVGFSLIQVLNVDVYNYLVEDSKGNVEFFYTLEDVLAYIDVEIVGD